MAVEEILAVFPYLEPEVITQALRSAAEAVRAGEVLRLDVPDVGILDHAVREAGVVVASEGRVAVRTLPITEPWTTQRRSHGS